MRQFIHSSHFRLHGPIDRAETEKLLTANGMFDGSFLVREKLHTANRVVLVLSLVSSGYFRHHLLERRDDAPFLVDGGLQVGVMCSIPNRHSGDSSWVLYNSSRHHSAAVDAPSHHSYRAGWSRQQ